MNEEVAHGIPGDRVVRAGDIVNIDVSAELDGFFADMGASFPVMQVAPRAQSLLRATRRAHKNALSVMRTGQRFNATGREVERVARQHGFTAIRDLCAHGVGRWLHEEPFEIANVFQANDERRFREGMVIAMETFLSLGSDGVKQAKDGWTLRTADDSLAAQYEHTVVVTGRGPLVVTVA